MVYIGALVLIIPLWYIWDWWTDGVIDAAEAIGLSALLFIVLGQMAVFPNPGLRIALFILLLASAVLMPWIGSTVEKVAQSRYAAEQISKFKMAIAVDGGNLAARLHLAKALYDTGKLDEAVAELEAAFAVSRLSFQEDRLLSEWKEERRLRDTKNVFCPRCGNENERGSAACVRCRTPLARGFAADWARSGGPVAAIRAWALAVACVTAILLVSAVFPKLFSPNPIAVAVIGLVAWLVFYTVSRRKRR
jgi:hypothetical protein